MTSSWTEVNKEKYRVTEREREEGAKEMESDREVFGIFQCFLNQ